MSAYRARARDLLHTPHGTIETPVFMPVGTQATVKGLTQRDLAEDLGVRILLANTYHLYLRPGPRTDPQTGRAAPLHVLAQRHPHRFRRLPGVQPERTAQDHRRRRVIFQSHLNGDPHTFTPESTVDVQLAFGSDILMVLDECPEYPVSHEYARQSMQRTLRWARQADRHYRQRMAESATAPRAVPHRAGLHVRRPARASAPRALVDLDADGYAIGGLSVGEPRPLSLEMVEATEDILPRAPAALRHGRGDARRNCRSTWPAAWT